MQIRGEDMHDRLLIGPWIRRFLLEYIIGERNLSRNTQTSYRDTLVLLLPFIRAHYKRSPDRLLIEDISPQIVRLFLAHLESARSCSVATRNQRLAAIHSLARFIGLRSPEHLAWSAEVRAIPLKKTAEPTIGYLDKAEMDAMLQIINRRTVLGTRNYALLLFLYNTGARADEAAHVHVADLALGRSPSVRIEGKGNKVRLCPLWPQTAEIVKQLITGHVDSDYLFRNARGAPLTRFGIYRLVRDVGMRALSGSPKLRSKRISPHIIRHTTAVHLLRAGVDINTIRAWLGHVSLDTTNIYAEVDLEMKAKALAHCEIVSEQPIRPWRNDPTLMAFLKAL
jgi:site-specific recombinase XerD